MKWNVRAARGHLPRCLTVICLGCVSTLAAQEARLPTADEIKALHAKYLAERDQVVKDGSARRFLPILLDQAEDLAKKGEAALAGGRLLQASEAFRLARWQLPYQSPQVPRDHVARVIGNLRLRHGHEINALAFSPDGQRLVTASKDRSVKVWDLGNGREMLSYHGHADHVNAATFSPDGKQCASAGADRDVRIWDASSGKDVRVIKGQGAYSTSLAWSRDGKYLVVGQAGGPGNSPGLMCIYDAATGELKRMVSDFRVPVGYVTFNNDNTILSAGVDDGQVRHWEFPKAAENPNHPEYWAQQDPSGPVHHLAFSPDNQTLARSGADGIKIYSVNVPGTPFSVERPAPRAAAARARHPLHVFAVQQGQQDAVRRLHRRHHSPVRPGDRPGDRHVQGPPGRDSRPGVQPGIGKLASASADHTVRLWDFDVVQQARDFAGHDAPVWSAALSPDGRLLVSASADRSLKIWNVATGKVLHTLSGHTSAVTAAVFSPDSRWVVSASGDALLKMWDANTGKWVRDLAGHKGTVTCLDVSSDGTRIVSGSVDKTVKVWDAATGKEALNIATDAIVAAVAVRPDGQQIAVGAIDQTVSLYNLRGQTDQRWLAHGTAVTGLAYSPNGQYLASCGADQLVRVWTLATPGTNPITLSGHSGPLTGVAFRKDNQHLASCGSDLIVRLWKLDNGAGKEVQTYRGHRDWVTSVAFSKDGFYVVSAGVDKVVKLWEITSRDIPLLAEHTGAVEAVALSPDGKKIASGASDRTIKIWDRATGVELATLTGHADAVISLVFAPDSRTLVSSSADKSIRIWDVTTGKELPRSPSQQQSFTGLINPAQYITLAPDGRRLHAWIPGNDRYTSINAYDLATGAEHFSITDQGRRVDALAFSADGKTAATASGAKGGSIRVWDLDKRQLLPGGDWLLFDKNIGPGDLALSPDGKTLIATSDAGDIKICAVAGREVIRSLKGHNQKIIAVQASLDGKRFATIGANFAVKFWDLASGQELRFWDMSLPAVDRLSFNPGLAFSPDGKQLVTGNANGTLFVLDLP